MYKSEMMLGRVVAVHGRSMVVFMLLGARSGFSDGLFAKQETQER